ncbi:DegT/DnrJ/EryC1/StrS family aminotransferase [Fulvivirga ulvae]|uniref:DegT/DnrJ/EryC1/StrS family aminotransferase n=1 Tax=Fulvivirga ulvae TaxID=2904245 RepID=UPI001F311270|nr:DegT/DnrJ/EryC1/StrS family aminotransferase [Fulvivirga ulvae]UII31640.1 DegT/DnrJ/EryC1/StrS family aminotransferase [Fulvivirga ulvae]
MEERIYLSSPHMGEKELEYINEAFRTNWISPVGPNIEGFECDLSLFTDGYHAAALSSGTAAIHLALIILGVKENDEVICSSFTFSGSCNPIVYLKASPVFVDSESDTWNMDPELLKVAIADRITKGKKPKAIILVHLYGMPAKMDEILTIAREYEIPVIEDAAEALGSKYKGQKLGTFGDIGIFSFNGNKIITTSGGGALISKHLQYIQKAKFLATQARDEAPHYEHSEIGFNYRMSNICAGIGRGQMTVLNERINQRRKVYNFYLQNLSQDGISFLEEPKGHFSNRWLTTITLSPEVSVEHIRIALDRKNIEVRPLWKPMHKQPVFEGVPYYGSGVCEKLFERGLCLPSGSNLTFEQQNAVIQAIKSLI